MCRRDDVKPSTMPADSPYTSFDSDASDHDWNTDAPQAGGQSTIKDISSSAGNKIRSGVLGTVVSIVAALVLAAAVTVFSFWLPFVMAPGAAGETYVWAYYEYDDKTSFFDNTAWTYGTDYGLAVVMGTLSISILKLSRRGVSDTLSLRSAGLLLGYCISVIAGGYGHHYYTTLESRNSLSFKLLWTVCVGTVTGASSWMGASATEVIRKFQQEPDCSPMLRKIPIINESFWWTYGLATTAVCAAGGMSFQRPACDIFIAGTTQFPPTFYLMGFFVAVQHSQVTLAARVAGFVGFILNAPLLPMYPLLVQYTDWSLASVNTLLHSWLCVAWSMQGYSLRHMTDALVVSNEGLNSRKKRS